MRKKVLRFHKALLKEYLHLTEKVPFYYWYYPCLFITDGIISTTDQGKTTITLHRFRESIKKFA